MGIESEQKMMRRWSDWKYIKEKVQRCWDKGDMLKAAMESEFPTATLSGSQTAMPSEIIEAPQAEIVSGTPAAMPPEHRNVFPMTIRLTVPTQKEISENLSAVIKWTEDLQRKEKLAIGYGYRLSFKEKNFREIGRNSLPEYAIIDSIEDAVKLLGTQTELKSFIDNCRLLLASFPALRTWIFKNTLRLSKQDAATVSKEICVLNWFMQGKAQGLYLRQLDIPGVDTKFIETHNGIISEMLMEVLPKEKFDATAKNFENRFLLLRKPVFVRVRLLDGCCAPEKTVSTPNSASPAMPVPVTNSASPVYVSTPNSASSAPVPTNNSASSATVSTPNSRTVSSNSSAENWQSQSQPQSQLQSQPQSQPQPQLQLHSAPFTDMSVRLDEFAVWNPPFKTVFITENEVNYLSFPNVSDACIIFGKGYGADIFKNIEWLKYKNIFYWGDIDTHGFNILSVVRGFLPQTQSFLMSERVLLEHKSLWGTEEKQFAGEVKNLTIDENILFNRLRSGYYGEKVRLEQERIAYGFVKEFCEKHLM